MKELLISCSFPSLIPLFYLIIMLCPFSLGFKKPIKYLLDYSMLLVVQTRESGTFYTVYLFRVDLMNQSTLSNSLSSSESQHKEIEIFPPVMASI